ncbi:MAG: potassium transporter TrkG [Eubacteriales bacterium]|nr:potassium transporter TrkG [Eubacteriales bacterium]
MNKRLKGIRPIRILPLGFLVIILIGAGLLCLPAASKSGVGMPFVDALFTATSATCVTGLVVADTGTQFTMFGQVVILCLIQVGGLGFMTMAATLFTLVRKQVSLYERMTLMEGLGESGMTGLRRIAITAGKVTAITEVSGALLLSIRFIPQFGVGKGIWYSIFHSISAFCNAGFDVMGTGTSFEVLYTGDVLVNLTLAALIIIGGLGFAVVCGIIRQPRPKKWRLGTRMVVCATAVLIMLGWALFTFLEWDNAYAALPTSQKFLAGFFQSVTLRTAGFSTVSQNALSEVSRFICIVWMLIGGSPAGTAGGIKTTTLVVLLLAVRAMLQNKSDVTVSKRKLSTALILRALSLVVFAVGSLFVSTILVSIFERTNPMQLGVLNNLFELTSALATVGLTVGLSAIASVGTKLVLIVLMFLGRVGLITVALSFTKQKKDVLMRYPEEDIPIG